eukprot:2898800-Amphidinium_carterae.1
MDGMEGIAHILFQASAPWMEWLSQNPKGDKEKRREAGRDYSGMQVLLPSVLRVQQLGLGTELQGV